MHNENARDKDVRPEVTSLRGCDEVRYCDFSQDWGVDRTPISTELSENWIFKPGLGSRDH